MFAMFNNTNIGANRMKFITLTRISYIPSFIQTELTDKKYKFTCAGSFIFVMRKERAAFAAMSAVSLPRILTWLGI